MTVARRSPSVPLLAAALLLAVAAASPAAGAEELTRKLEKTFTPAAGETVRLANLAGKLELVAGDGDAVRVSAVLHVEAGDETESRRLLDGMEWVANPDRQGGWALSYPLGNYRTFRYPSHGRRVLSWIGGSTTTYMGKKVRVTGNEGPVVYADLVVTYPARVPLAVRVVVGDVHGGALYGDLDVDTGSADVTLASFNGSLRVDTGSGDVEVGSFRGTSGSVDTGSGDVAIGGVEADKLYCDTGSGNVTVRDGRVEALVVDAGSGRISIDGVAVVTAGLDTGSGDVLLRGDLSRARRIVADTGSGDVEIYGGPGFTFAAAADQGSGELAVHYADATLERDGRKVVGARRGAERTAVTIDTGSGDALLAP